VAGAERGIPFVVEQPVTRCRAQKPDPGSFLWDGMEHSRCSDDGRRLRSIAAGGPCSGSLMPDENSLFTQINSLFRRKFSLFGCVGNSVQEANDYAWLER
jgi:hypothetical protein